MYEKQLENNKQQPKELQKDGNIFIKNTKRQTKDKEPYKISTVKEDNLLTYNDHNNIKFIKIGSKTKAKL